MKIIKSSKEDLFKSVGINQSDTILYLGGRIDDDNLYPSEYIKYLNSKIKKLNPSKIICHNHFYAKKYYQKGVLDIDDKIDMVVVQYDYMTQGNLQTIHPSDYSDYREWMKILINKNPKMVCGMYISEGQKPDSVIADTKWFTEDYEKNKIKYFSFDRGYSPKDLTGEDLGLGTNTRNASDGFGMIINLLNLGFSDLNILGFTAFGSDEDMSYHTAYECRGDPRFKGKKLFDLETSEDLPTESNILKYWINTGKIKNIEDHKTLMSYLK
tara:strand:- start:3917 stop:4723 length:807 start_codon:yes stop_codon:yes gene_type:complete